MTSRDEIESESPTEMRCKPCGYLGKIELFTEDKCPACESEDIDPVIPGDISPTGFHELGRNAEDPGFATDFIKGVTPLSQGMSPETRKMFDTSKKPDLNNPHIVGSNGRAWSVPISEDRTPALLARWLINYPGIHAVWEWWAWNLITLDAVEGVPPAKKDYPEARYEVMCLALDPEHEPDLTGEGALHYLTPPDLTKQFHVDNDLLGIALVANSIVYMVNGSGPPPDSDYHRWWEKHIDEAAAHAREIKPPHRRLHRR